MLIDRPAAVDATPLNAATLRMNLRRIRIGEPESRRSIRLARPQCTSHTVATGRMTAHGQPTEGIRILAVDETVEGVRLFREQIKARRCRRPIDIIEVRRDLRGG